MRDSDSDFVAALAEAEAARHFGPIVDFIERKQGAITDAQLAVLRELPYGDDGLDALARAMNLYEDLRYHYRIKASSKRVEMILERWPSLSRHEIERHVVRRNGGKRTERIQARADEFRRIENLRHPSEIADS